MTFTVYDSSRKRITLGKQVAHGGEAAVYRVQGQPNLLAKIYTPPIHPNYKPKVAWMIDRPPEEPDYSIDVDEHQALAWPIDLLRDRKGVFLGYLMPRIQGGVTLLHIFNPRLRAQSLPFDRKYLHRTARNLAAAVASLHAKGYVIGDLHESNVIVTRQALVTMIDTDSFQVQTEEVCYHCIVGKPDYTAPELQGRRLADVVRKPEHDGFALAVLVFQLLMEGNHPFRSRWLPRSEPPSLAEKISMGLFPHVKPPRKQVVPPPNTPSMDTLHPTLSTLMVRCFVDGHDTPHLRPSATEWRGGLEEAEAALVQCRRGHYYANHLKKCPQCETARRAARRAVGRAAARTVRQVTFPPRIQQRRWQRGTYKWPRQPQPSTAATRWAPGQPQIVRVTAQLWQFVRGPRALRWVQGQWARLGSRRWVYAVVAAIVLLIAGGMLIAGLGRTQATQQPIATVPPTAFPRAPGVLDRRPESTISPKNVKQMTRVLQWEEWRSADIYDVAWSPDGSRLAVAASDSISVYEFQSAQSLRQVWISPSKTEYEGTEIAFSPGGALVLAADEYGQPALWSTRTGQEVKVLGANSHLSGDFSTDGKLVASGSMNTVTLWDLETGEELISIPHPGAADSITFSPCGTLLAVDGSVWHMSTRKKVLSLKGPGGHARKITSTAFSPDGRLLASGSIDGTVMLWDSVSGRLVDTFLTADGIGDVGFSPDGRLLAASGKESIRLWDVGTGLQVRTLSGHSRIKTIAFSPDGTMLTSAGPGDALFMWGTLGAPGVPRMATATPRLAKMSGIVTDSDTGKPLSQANVTTYPPTASVTTSAFGEFSISDVPLGRYRIYARRPGYIDGSVGVTVRAGEIADASIELLPYERDMRGFIATATPRALLGAIGGFVVDFYTDAPLSGANITTDPPTASVTTNANGEFSIPNMPPGSYTVIAVRPGYEGASAELTVEADRTAMAHIGLRPLVVSTGTPTPFTATWTPPPTLEPTPIATTPRPTPLPLGAKPADIVLVLDTSASMAYDTLCFGCWEYDPATMDAPTIHPLPWASFQDEIWPPDSPSSCQGWTNPDPSVLPRGQFNCGSYTTGNTLPGGYEKNDCYYRTDDGSDDYYTIIEAEEYSAIEGEDYRAPELHSTYWVIQRDGNGSYGRDNKGGYIAHHPPLAYSATGQNQYGVSCTAADIQNGGICRRKWSTEPFMSVPPGVPDELLGRWRAPRADYDFVAPRPGNYFFWVRAKGRGAASFRYMHWGLDGVYLGDEGEFDAGKWYWRRLRDEANDSDSVYLDGGQIYTLNIWAGGAGVMLDRLVITTDASHYTGRGSTLPEGFWQMTEAWPNNARTRQACSPCDQRYAGWYPTAIDPTHPSDPDHKDNIDFGELKYNLDGTAYWRPWCRNPIDPHDRPDMRRDVIYKGKQPLYDILQASSEFVAAVDPTEYRIGYVSYSSEATIRSELTYRHEDVIHELDATRTDGETAFNIAAAIRAGRQALKQESCEGDTSGNCAQRDVGKVMFLVIAGHASLSPTWCIDPPDLVPDRYVRGESEAKAADCAAYEAIQASEEGIVIHTITLGDGADQYLAQTISDSSGGTHYHMVDPAQLPRVLSHIHGTLPEFPGFHWNPGFQ